jgi:hypothetical protein
MFFQGFGPLLGLMKGVEYEAMEKDGQYYRLELAEN